jgi:hypothetical protein
LHLAGLFAIILFMLPRSTAESALLEPGDAARYSRREKTPAWHSGVNAGSGGQAFTLFRSLFSTEPDPGSGPAADCLPVIENQPMPIFF